MKEKFQADSDCGSFPFSNDKYKNNGGNLLEITFDMLIKPINGTFENLCYKESRLFKREHPLLGFFSSPGSSLIRCF